MRDSISEIENKPPDQLVLKGGTVNMRIFLLIFLFLFSLVTALLVTQYNSNNSILNLQKSSIQAANTFRINNLMQKVVNEANALEFSIRRSLLQDQPKKINTQVITDSIADLSTKYGSMVQFVKNGFNYPENDSLNFYIEKKIDYLNKQLLALKQKKEGVIIGENEAQLVRFPLNDSIHFYTQQLQGLMQQDLQDSLLKNESYSERILKLSRGLSILAVAAIAFLGTIIIKRIHTNDKLTNALREAKQHEEEMSRVKDHFVSNMSHEIRTPINAVIGFTNLLGKTKLNEEQRNYINTIQASGQLLVSIVNDVLDVSKINEHKLILKSDAFNPRSIFETIRDMFHLNALQKGLQLNMEYDERIPELLYGEAERLLQIMVNLVNNAIKFTNNGFVQVYFQLSELNTTNAMIHIRVRDSGIGIDAANHDRVFQRFEQLPSGSKNFESGTGLGLAIVKSLVQLKGGTILLESEIGEGATFIVNLPFKLANPEALAHAELHTVNETEISHTKVSFKGAKVLVAEDNEINQMLIQHLLKEWEVIPTMVNNGLETINVLKDDVAFDLILMDIRMPVMTGDEAAAVIRTQMNLNIPIVAMSAYSRSETFGIVNNAQVNEYLPKPIEPAGLLKMLHKYLIAVEDININSLLDKSWLTKNYSANNKIIGLILNQFKIQLQVECDLLKEAVAQKNMDDVSKICHSLITTVTTINKNSGMRPIIQEISWNGSGLQDWDIAEFQLSSLLAMVPKAIEEAANWQAELEKNSQLAV